MDKRPIQRRIGGCIKLIFITNLISYVKYVIRETTKGELIFLIILISLSALEIIYLKIIMITILTVISITIMLWMHFHWWGKTNRMFDRAIADINRNHDYFIKRMELETELRLLGAQNNE